MLTINLPEMPWAGLIYCKPNRWYVPSTHQHSSKAAKTDDRQRVACFEFKSPVTVTKGEPCTCPPATETDYVAFSAPPVIPAVALLPTTYGGLIEWQAGHFPTADPAASSTTTRQSDSVTATSTSTGSTSTATSLLPEQTSTVPPPTRGLSDGVKAGIGIGAVVGAILLFGALSAVWMVMRRRRNEQANDTTSVPFNPEAGQAHGATHTLPHQNDKTPELGLTPTPQLAEMPAPEVFARPVTLSELPAGPWGMRPELQGDGGTLAGPSQRPPSGLIWDGQIQGWVHGPLSPLSPMSPTSMMPLSPLSTVADERNHLAQSQTQGQGQWQGH